MSSLNISNDNAHPDPTSWEFSVLCESHYDHGGIWEAVILAREKKRTVGREEILQGIARLMQLSLLEAGYPTPDGRGFEPWDGSIFSIIGRIRREWKALGRDPYLGEIVWFNATPAGDRVVEGFDRER